MKWFDNTALTLVIIGALNFPELFIPLSVYVDFISSAFMEESEVHPKKGVSVLWMPLLYFYILFFGNCFHNCCHIFIK